MIRRPIHLLESSGREATLPIFDVSLEDFWVYSERHLNSVISLTGQRHGVEILKRSWLVLGTCLLLFPPAEVSAQCGHERWSVRTEASSRSVSE